jgi:hypothetical protein
MTLPLLLHLDVAAGLTLLAAITVLPAAAAAICWALPTPRRPRPGTTRAALLAAGPARTPTRRRSAGALGVHWRGFAAHRHGLRRLTLLLAGPGTAAVLTAGRLLPWHVTLATSEAVATVTRRSSRTWVLTNFARLPGEAHRGAGEPLLCQILAAAAANGAAVQLTAGSDELLGYYRRHGFTPAPGARSPRRLTRPS